MAKGFKLDVKGLVRFSYLSENGFAMSKAGMKAVRETLYAPERLDRRFRLFETLSLHCLRQQRDQSFTAGVLIGEDFPDKPRARLEDMIADMSNVHLIVRPPMIHIKATVEAFAELPSDPKATHTATFRLDDDDAMHLDTVSRIRTIAAQVMPIRNANMPFAIAFNRGFYLDSASDEPVQEMYEKTPLGVGLAVVARVGDPANAFRRNHRSIAQFYDTYTEVAAPMFIRSVHPDNDSGAQATGRKGTMGPKRIMRHLREGFGLEIEDLDAL